MTPAHRDLTRTVLAVLSISLLILSTFWILRPFLLPLVWATMIAVATWPMLLGVQERCRGRRAPAVAIMSSGLLLTLILPMTVGVLTIVRNAEAIKRWIKELSANGLPDPPAWVETLPLVGHKAAALWTDAAAAGPEGLSAQLAFFAQKGVTWFVGHAGGMGLIAVQFLLALVLTAILYANGEIAADGVRNFFRRLAGEQGVEIVAIAGKAIRAVAVGIVVTALVQAGLGGLGLWVAGIPGAGLLTAVMFVLAIAQIGVVPVLALAVAWLFWKDATAWAVVLLIWTIAVGAIDNVLRPLLIRKGADLPLLLIFAGVIGGLVAFGIIGLFIGPVALAVAYTLVRVWIAQGPAEEK